jgi:hypothetical protein
MHSILGHPSFLLSLLLALRGQASPQGLCLLLGRGLDGRRLEPVLGQLCRVHRQMRADQHAGPHNGHMRPYSEGETGASSSEIELECFCLSLSLSLSLCVYVCVCVCVCAESWPC